MEQRGWERAVDWDSTVVSIVKQGSNDWYGRPCWNVRYIRRSDGRMCGHILFGPDELAIYKLFKNSSR